jgi:hypothetical protein
MLAKVLETLSFDVGSFSTVFVVVTLLRWLDARRAVASRQD